MSLAVEELKDHIGVTLQTGRTEAPKIVTAKGLEKVRILLQSLLQPPSIHLH